MSLNDILTQINDVMYTYVLIIMLAGVGIYFTIRTRGVQFRLLKVTSRGGLTNDTIWNTNGSIAGYDHHRYYDRVVAGTEQYFTVVQCQQIRN